MIDNPSVKLVDLTDEFLEPAPHLALEEPPEEERQEAAGQLEEPQQHQHSHLGVVVVVCGGYGIGVVVEVGVGVVVVVMVLTGGLGWNRNRVDQWTWVNYFTHLNYI